MVASGQRYDLGTVRDRKGLWHRYKATIRLTCQCANDGIEFRPVSNRCCHRLHCERLCGSFEGVQPIFGIWRRCRVEEHCDSGSTRRNLFQYFHPLARLSRLRNAETGYVATGPRKTRDEAAADRIAEVREHDGDGTRLL